MDWKATGTQSMHRINQAQLIALVSGGLIDKGLAAQIAVALDDIDQAGRGAPDYLEVEKELVGRVGAGASNIHLGRSRNDIGATAERMAVRPAVHRACSALLDLRQALMDQAAGHTTSVIPAYTHGRAAQPTTLAHYFAAAADALARDCERLRQSYRRLNLSPLGAGALATSGFPLDRPLLANHLGFDGLLENSYDAVGISPGDSKAEVAAVVLTSGLTLSRLAQDLVLFTMDEIGFLSLSRKQTGGSSIMPQKQNPGALERARSAVAAVTGHVWAVMAEGHNTHLQDTHDVRIGALEHVLNAIEAFCGACDLIAESVRGLTVDSDRGREICLSTFCTATELADTLVRHRGLDFRSAHTVSSAAARWLRERGRTADKLSSSELADIAEKAVGARIDLDEETLRRSVDPESFVAVRGNRGGPAPEEVERALVDRAEALARDRDWLDEQRKRLADADAARQTWIAELIREAEGQ